MRRNDVLLINPIMPSPQAHSGYSALSPPLGLGYMAAALEQEGIQAEVLDLNICKEPMHELASSLDARGLKIAGITGFTQNIAEAFKAAQSIKSLKKDIFVAIGGPHVSFLPEEALSEPAIDAVVHFEGEKTVVDLFNECQRKTPQLSKVQGISYRSNGKINTTEKRSLESNLDQIPFPSRHLFPMAQYDRPGTIMSSRGCPKNCIFCISSSYEGNYRTRSAENVVEELRILRNTWGIREIWFLDNVFTADETRVHDICQGIIDLDLDLWFHCVSRANLVTEELVAWLKAAGCRRIEIGVETATQDHINQLEKGITIEQVHKAADIVLGQGLAPMFTFQFGSPFDSEDSLVATQQLTADLRAKGAMILISIMVPFPGTKIANKAGEYGIQIKSKDWSEYRASNPTYDTRYLKRNDIRKAFCREYLAETAPRADHAYHSRIV